MTSPAPQPGPKQIPSVPPRVSRWWEKKVRYRIRTRSR